MTKYVGTYFSHFTVLHCPRNNNWTFKLLAELNIIIVVN